MSHIHTGLTYSALAKGQGQTPSLPGQGAEHIFNPSSYQTVYIATEDVAELLHVTVTSAQKLIREGKIKASFIGRRWLTTRSNVDAYLQSKAEGGPEIQ